MIRNGMGPDVRSALREKFRLKLRAVCVEFYNECHGEDGKFCETHGVTHGEKRVVEDDGFGVSKQPRNRSRLGKVVEGGIPGVTAEELEGIRAVRKKTVTSKRLNFETFENEVAPLRRQVNVDKEEVWLTKEEFLARRDNRGMSALERYGRSDLHGLVVEQNGKYLDPFSSSHAVIRLHQGGMPKLINRVVKKVTGEEALSVELKPTKVSGSRASRDKNRLYLIAGERGGTKVALNVVIQPNGLVKTAFLELANGSYGGTPQVRAALKAAGVKLPNRVIKVEEFK